jgi:hypothetical protein
VGSVMLGWCGSWLSQLPALSTRSTANNTTAHREGEAEEVAPGEGAMIVYLRRPRDQKCRLDARRESAQRLHEAQPHLTPHSVPNCTRPISNQLSHFSSETRHVLRTIALSQSIATTNHPNYRRVSDVKFLLFGSSCGAILAIVGGAANLKLFNAPHHESLRDSCRCIYCSIDCGMAGHLVILKSSRQLIFDQNLHSPEPSTSISIYPSDPESSLS